MEGIGEFIYTQSKPLPVILLLDTSKSMAKNDNIGTLNNAVFEMIKTLQSSSGNEANVQIAVITFGEDTGVQLPLQDVNKISHRFDLKARGGTFMAKAIDIAKGIIEDKEMNPSRSYRPIVIMVTDGAPVDNWRVAMDKFINQGRSSKCFRMAMGIGNGAEGISKEVLETFVSSRDYLFSANNAMEIASFFQYATMTAQKSIPRAVAQVEDKEKEKMEQEQRLTVTDSKVTEMAKDEGGDDYLEDLILY